MKKLFLFFVLMFCGVLVAQEVTETVSLVDKVLDWFKGAWSWAPMALAWLGGVVVAGTIIDKLVPDTYDKGFMSKLYNLPIIGTILKSLVRFSPFSADVEQVKK